MSINKVVVVGCGLAGTEAAFYLAYQGIEVVILESKRISPNPMQKNHPWPAQLVCSNSLKSNAFDSPQGILKGEMRALGSVILKAALKWAVPAGQALAVDRIKMSQEIDDLIQKHPKITLIPYEVSDPIEAMLKYKADKVIVASGPLTTPPLEKWMKENIANDNLYFYDALAPIIDGSSLDYEKLYFMDRYQHGDGDYLNAPLSKNEYEKFVEELSFASKVPLREFEKEIFFEGCLPIDTMAMRGLDTLRFSCMKPVGLSHKGVCPHAVVQLRKENLLGDAYNLVGFQTRLTYTEQKRVFSLIPGLENVNFLRYGQIHRNTFIWAQKLLNFDLSLKKNPQIYFTGQICGVEGYMESAMSGLYVAWQIVNGTPKRWPLETATGALINFLMTSPSPTPINVNMGLFPPIELLPAERRQRKERKRIKKEKQAKRAIEYLGRFL